MIPVTLGPWGSSCPTPTAPPGATIRIGSTIERAAAEAKRSGGLGLSGLGGSFKLFHFPGAKA